MASHGYGHVSVSDKGTAILGNFYVVNILSSAEQRMEVYTDSGPDVQYFSAYGKRCNCRKVDSRMRRRKVRVLWGRVVFRYHYCRQCSTSSTDIRINLLHWLCQRYFYYSSRPEPTFKLPRTVPWGTEENVLKHVLTGNLEGVRDLILSGRASVYDVEPNQGRSALQYAVQKGRINICKFLLFMKADPDFEDFNGGTADSKAWECIQARRGTESYLTELRYLFSDYDRDSQGFSHLHYVVVGERPIALKQELEKSHYRGILNAVDIQGRTPLHWACDRGDAESVQTLVDAGAELNVKDAHGSTPLIFAASSGNMIIIKKLLSGGADPAVHSNRGDSPLHFASRHQAEVAPVRALVEAGSSVDHKNSLLNTPLTGAAMMNRWEIGKYLIGVKADIHTRGIYGDTPLFESIHNNSHEFTKMLLEYGARTTVVNNYRNTILHVAGFEGDNRTIELLLESTAVLPNREAKNKAGEDARSLFGKRLKVPKGFEDLFNKLLVKADAARQI